jgi:hypothetical protein
MKRFYEHRIQNIYNNNNKIFLYLVILRDFVFYFNSFFIPL